MYTIKELQDIINNTIEYEDLSREPQSLYEPIIYTLESGGKRIRPVLTLMACNLFSDDIKPALKPALALEIFHNFTLLHDDIMDNADIRRGNATVHKKWNENTAILSGDAMFIKAYEYFLDCQSSNFREILKTFNNTALEVCEGQQYDMEFEERDNVTEREYLKMIKLKTSVLLAASLKIGALTGNANAKNAELLYQFGIHIGIAFQLQDDYLDVYGDPKVFGKETGGDIVANKKTFMLIKALELAQEDDANKLKNLLLAKDIDRKSKIESVMSIYNKLNVKDIVHKRILDLNKKALEFLNKVSVETSKKEELKKLAEKLIQRIS